MSRQDRTRDKAYLAHIELDFNEVMRCFFVQGLASTGQPSKHITFLRKTVSPGGVGRVHTASSSDAGCSGFEPAPDLDPG